jgi:hypothetical protein
MVICSFEGGAAWMGIEWFVVLDSGVRTENIYCKTNLLCICVSSIWDGVAGPKVPCDIGVFCHELELKV